MIVDTRRHCGDGSNLAQYIAGRRIDSIPTASMKLSLLIDQ